MTKNHFKRPDLEYVLLLLLLEKDFRKQDDRNWNRRDQGRGRGRGGPMMYERII